MTKVENILTLLNAKYVGTPYLSFSLSPQPLEQLSADASDPSLWFSQLLQRRSSGIEGVQEFTGVILVPEGEEFCVHARLRRVCVLDDPPGPPNFQEPFSLTGPKLGRLLTYLFDTFPIGTPVLEELDVDVVQSLPQPELFPAPGDRDVGGERCWNDPRRHHLAAAPDLLPGEPCHCELQDLPRALARDAAQ